MRIQDCKHVIYQGDFIKRIYNANQILFEEQEPTATGYIRENAFSRTENNKRSIKELCNSNNVTQIIFTNNSGYYIIPGYELSWSGSYVSPNIEQSNTEPIVCHLKMTNSGITLFCVGNINSIVFPCLLDNFFSELTTITNIECKNINSFIDDVRSNVSLKRFCYKCNNLTTLRLGNLTCLGNGHLESLERAFEDCIKLKSINLNNFNFDSLDNENGLTKSFYNCLALEDIEENVFWEDIFSSDERMFYETFSYCNCEKVDIDFSGNKNPNNLYRTFKGAILHDVNFSNKSNLDDYVLRYEDLFRGATITGTLNLSNNLIEIYSSPSDDTYDSIIKAFFKNAKCFNVLMDNCYFYSSDSLSLVLKNFVFSLKFNNSVSFQNMWEKTSIISNNLFNYFIDKITGENPQLKELDFSNNVFDKNYIFDTGSTIPIRDASGNPTTRTKETCTNLHNLQVLKLNDTNITRLKHMGYSWYQENQDGTIHVEYNNYSPIKTLYLNNINNIDNDFISFYFDGMSGLKELYIQNRKIQNFMTKLWYVQGTSQWEKVYTNSAVSFNYQFEYLNIAGSQIKLTQDYFDIPLVQKIEGNSNTKFVGRGPFHFLDSHYASSRPDKRYMTVPDLFDFLPLANFDEAEITSINFQYLLMPSIDLSNISNYQYLTHIGFDTCPKLLEILFNDNIDTSNITDMSQMFNQCYSLTSLDISNFDTSNVITMEDMFWYLEDLPNINVSNFNTSKVTNMSHMFGRCKSIQTLNVSNFDTSNVEDMTWMFYECENLITIDVSNFNISKVIKSKDYLKNLPDDYYIRAYGYDWVIKIDKSLEGMFEKCTNLTSINLFDINVPNNKILYLDSIFYDCTNLTTVNINNLKYFCNFDGNDYYERDIVDHSGYTYRGKIILNTKIYASNMFYNCKNLQTIIVNHTDSPRINIINFDSGGEYYASTLTDKNIFPNCENLQGGNGTQWTSDTKDYTYFQADLPNQIGLLTYQAAQGGN